MIKVKIYKKENWIQGFSVTGHAFYDEPGRDIVCSAVSMLAINTIDTFTDLLMMEDDINYIYDNNLIKLEIINDSVIDKNHDSQLILKKFELGMKSLISEYGKYIRVDYMEV